MNAFRPTTALAAVCWLLTACGSQPETRQPAADPARTDSTALAVPADASANLLKILKPEKGGLLRGVRLGDPVERVTSLETVPLAEDSTTYKGFTEPLTDGVESEFADVLYRTDAQGHVRKIQVDVFLNEPDEVNTLLAELRGYFSTKYGPGQTASKRTTWALPDGTRLALSDESVKQAPGLRMLFSEGKPPAAPAQ